jgi:hypothetical protein
MRPVHASAFDPTKGPARLVGVIWEPIVQDDQTVVWRRLLLRAHSDTTPYYSPTIRVEAHEPCCLICLSTAVDVKPVKDQPWLWYMCNACHNEYRVGVEM